MTETQLLQAYAVKRDAEAFAEIVRRYQRLIFATCRRTLHHADDIDDAVQETFLRLAQKAGALRTNLGGWLHACAVHVSIDKNRRREVRLRHESAAKADEVMNDPALELKELREHLDRALEKIEADQRELIIQRFFVGRSQAELAAEAGVTPSAITHRMNAAIEALRRNLQAMGGVAIAGAGTAVLVRAMEAENASAAVPAELTRNLVKIGLSGTPAAGVAGAISFALMWKVIVAVIVLLALPLGVWLGSRNALESADSVAPVSATEPGGAPVMTVTGNGQPEVPSVPRWQATSGPVVRAPLSGRVVDSNGKPVANAIVSVSGPYANQSLKTDGNGEYVLPRIRGGGEYRIGVTADGFLPVEPYIGASASVELSASSQARRDMVLERGVGVAITVTDADGKPLKGADIGGGIVGDQFARRMRLDATTDRTGHARLTLPVSKMQYAIGATLDGYAPTHAMVTAASADKPQSITLLMERGISVTGLAICADGKPATGWGITAQPTWWAANTVLPEAKIDGVGKFTLQHVTAGEYQLWLESNDSGRQIGTVVVPPATQPFRVDVPWVSPSGRVKFAGRVRFVGCAPDNAQVELWSLTDHSFENANLDLRRDSTNNLGEDEGSFEFDSIVPGEYRLSIESTSIEKKTIERLTVPSELPEIEVHAAPNYRIGGTVVDAASGKLLSHFAVRVRKDETLGNGPNYVQDENWKQIDRADGAFDVKLVGAGIYEVQASAEGYAWLWSGKLTVESGNSSAHVVMKLTSGGSVTGVVVGANGAAVAGAKVIPPSMARSLSMGIPAEGGDRFASEAGAVVTDSVGRFTISHLSPGEETLKVIDPQFAPMRLPPCTIVEGKSTDIGTATISVGAAVSGVVYDGDGKPLPGVMLQFQDASGYSGQDDEVDGRLASLTTDENGGYRVEHLAPEVIYVNLADRWQASGVVRRVIRTMEGKSTRLDFGGTAATKGRCLKNGVPIGNTRVQLAVSQADFGAFVALGKTDGQGRFVFHGIPAGKYTLYTEDKTERRDWTELGDVKVADGDGDLGDIGRDVGEVLIHILADDPEDLKRIRYVSLTSADVGARWEPPIEPAAEGTAGDQWRCKELPPGKFRVTVMEGDESLPEFSVEFERKEGETHTPVELRLPRATATLNVKLQHAADLPDTMRDAAVIQSEDGNVQFYATSDQSQAHLFHVPAGTYRVMEQRASGPAVARADVGPVTLQNGESRDWEIPASVSSDGLCGVEVHVWTVDGVLATDWSATLVDGSGKVFSASVESGMGVKFQVPPGKYRAVVARAASANVEVDVDVTESKVARSYQIVNVNLK